MSKDRTTGRPLTPAELYIQEREKRLILHLLSPRSGERLLIIGCGGGDYSLFMQSKGCRVTFQEIDSFGTGAAEDLPYEDDEFDIVAVIAALEMTRSPQNVISEAVRVCRRRVFLGVRNRYSLVGTQQRISGILQQTVSGGTLPGGNLFSIGQLRRMIKRALGGDAPVQWGSVIFLPYGWYSFAGRIEENIPVFKNPFGAFLGLSFPVTYRYRTIQEPVSAFKLNIKRHEAPGAVRGMGRHSSPFQGISASE